MKFVRYAMVGVLTLAIYMAAGEVLRGFEMPFIWQASVPFTTAVAVNYLLQRGWVFNDSRPAATSLPRYAVMIMIGYGINLVTLIAFLPRMPLLLAQLTAAALVVVSNAVLSFSWVFLGGCGAKMLKR